MRRFLSILLTRKSLFLFIFSWAFPAFGDPGSRPAIDYDLTPTSQSQSRGLPFIRTYPLDEIGRVPPGLRLNFDSFGRVAVMYDGVYSVLNDTTWVDRIDPSFDGRVSMTTIAYSEQKYFYGGRGSWGLVTQTPSGLFRAHSLVPQDAPAWTAVTAFNGIMNVPGGVFFYDMSGIVYYDLAAQKNYFFPLSRVTVMFRLHDRVFAGSEDHSLREISLVDKTVHILTAADHFSSYVSSAAQLNDSTELVGLRNGDLYTFDGTQAMAWAPQKKYGITGPITAMEHLIDGGVALAVGGKGLYIFSDKGGLQWALPLPEFRRISTMTTGESGVLWAAGENALHKIFYRSPLTSFGQELGLPALWPQVVEWDHKLMVCTNRTVYQLNKAPEGEPSRFQIDEAAPDGCTCAAANKDHFLVGTADGVWAKTGDGKYLSILPLADVSSIEFIDDDTCIVVGGGQIAALHYNNGQWKESAERIAGVGEAPIRTLLHHGLWIEMGGDRIMRVRLENGELKAKRIQPPWQGGQWTNIGVFGKWLIFSDATSQRTFYDDTTDSFSDVPEIRHWLDRSPYWITRITEDNTGTLWGTHAHGVVTFRRHGGDYTIDSSTFELRNDSYPRMVLLPETGAWILTGRSMYHVETGGMSEKPQARAILVSLRSEDRNQELLAPNSGYPVTSDFASNENSLGFRFFSGTYAWHNPPLYEYRLSNTDPWAQMDRSLSLHFPKLKEGKYNLQVRPAEPENGSAPLFHFDFLIRPPWYSKPTSYAAYAVIGLLLIFALVRWTNHHSLKRNTSLELVVAERTKLLEATMQLLGEESRNTATMAERSRLAGEIHDSLQQGLSGSIIQLDTTLANSEISSDARSRLNIVRNMLSYIREEIQHAVWNLESPLLHNSNLGDALKKLAGFINSGTQQINITVPPQPIVLQSNIQHNLLRIAQEAITNAVKHANANCIEVVLATFENEVSLIVTDDGLGFDPAVSSNTPAHFGLRGMRTRAKSMKADLQVKSDNGRGTIVTVRVPFEKTNSHEPAS